jgi:hypothetical protein
MLNGELDLSFYLSSLHPGIGKSTAIICWVQAYQQSQDKHGSHGVIMCFDRHEEIHRIVKDLNLPADSFAVVVADDDKGRELNGMGRGSNSVDGALIVLTTKQQMLMPGQRGRHFNDMHKFFYRGKPRMIRIWDETLTCGKGLKLVVRKLDKLPDDLSDSYPGIANELEKISEGLRRCTNTDTYYIKDLSVRARSVLSTFKWSTTGNKDTALALLQLLGRLVTVRSNDRGFVAIDCTETIPVGFAPCIVTDASGEVRDGYNLQDQYRGNLVRLKGAAKNYGKLTVNVWRHASGRTAYEEYGNAVYVKEIVSVINSRPTEEFLVLRLLSNPELEDEIKDQVTQPERVHFTHYGVHTATNVYRNIPNMIVSGLMAYRSEDYEALAMASAGLSTSNGKLTPEQLNHFRHGEYAHHLLQAVCRIRVRKSEGAGCPESRVWIIAPKGILPDEQLVDIFPSCVVERWRTTPQALKGLRLQALEYLADKIASGMSEISSITVKNHLRMTQSNFKRDILDNDDFNDSLQHREISIEKRSNGRYFFNDTSYLRVLVSGVTESNQTRINTSF